MDGPNLNFEVLRLLDELREQDELPSIINVGSCCLHVLHGPFQIGIKKVDWQLGKVMKAMWQLLHDSIARRDIYSKVSESEEFPRRKV